MYIVTANEMYELDRSTTETIGLSEEILMENAGRAVARKITEVVTNDEKIGVLIGPGNNGGDGFVIARTLKTQGFTPEIVQITPDEKINGAAFYHKQLLQKIGGTVRVTDQPEKIAEIVKNWDVVIDAMLGIGVKDALREPFRHIVTLLNDLKACVISVDVPTGLPADEGVDEFLAVQANHTFIIEAAKMSLFIEATAPFYGKWQVVPIGIPLQQWPDMLMRQTWEKTDFKQTMPIRERYAHKGRHGKGLVLGGTKTMPGSVAMAGKAALKAGAGLITIGTSKQAVASIAPICVEATYLEAFGDHDQADAEAASLPVASFDGIAVGMGIGRGHFAEHIVLNALEARKPVIVDADGLYHLKSHLARIQKRARPTIITPHPGEMARLMDLSIAELLRSPFYYAKQLATMYGIYVVLKGAHTIVTSPDGRQAVNVTGNQGLAKGGSGDVLSGIVLAMVMQHDDIFHGICNACFVHGASADLQVEQGHTYYDLLATDVIDGLPEVFRTFL